MNADSDVSTLTEQFRRLQSGIKSFAEDMREQGIHVGMGSDPHCVNCGEKWPCEASKR